MALNKDDRVRLIMFGIVLLVIVAMWFGYRLMEASNDAYRLSHIWYTEPTTSGLVDLTPLKGQIEEAMSDRYLSQGEWMDIRNAKVALEVDAENAEREAYKAKWKDMK